MLTVESVITRLERATNPARSLDSSIGELFGWIKMIEMVEDPKRGSIRVVKWLSPSGQRGQEPPRYTFDLQAAYDLSSVVDYAAAWAIALETDTESARAQVDGDAPCKGYNVQIALCVAALKRHQKNTGLR